MTERDSQVVKLFNAGMSMPKIGKQLNLTRQGVRYILNKYGRTGKQRIQDRASKRQNRLLELLEENPNMSLVELEISLGCEKHLIMKDLTKLSIKRDTSLLLSEAVKKGWRKDRVDLTRDLLFRLRVTERKTQKQIAEITRYGESTISRYLIKFRIKKPRK